MLILSQSILWQEKRRTLRFTGGGEKSEPNPGLEITHFNRLNSWGGENPPPSVCKRLLGFAGLFHGDDNFSFSVSFS